MFPSLRCRPSDPSLPGCPQTARRQTTLQRVSKCLCNSSLTGRSDFSDRTARETRVRLRCSPTRPPSLTDPCRRLRRHQRLRFTSRFSTHAFTGIFAHRSRLKTTANLSGTPVNTGRNAHSRVAGFPKRVAGAKNTPFLSVKCASYVR